MSYQEAIAVPILFELTDGAFGLSGFGDDTEVFHKRVAERFPSASERLARQTISDGSQTKLYNSIRQGIRKLAKSDPSPVNWERRSRIEINDAGVSYLRRVIEGYLDQNAKAGEIAAAISQAKSSANEDFLLVIRKHRKALREALVLFWQKMNDLR